MAFLVVVESILLGPPALRIPAGLILGLILPGLAIAPLLTWPRIEGVEKLLLVPGLSIVIAIVAGFVMSAAGVRLTMESWAVALGLITAGGLAIRAVLERNGEGRMDMDPYEEAASSRALWNEQRRVRGVAPVAMLLLAALFAAGALMIGIWGERYRGSGFTELWALPGPSSMSPVRLGVISHEGHEVRYTLRVSLKGRVIRTQQITLRPGETWQSMQSVGTASEEVGVSLQKSSTGTVYREVHVFAGALSG